LDHGINGKDGIRGKRLYHPSASSGQAPLTEITEGDSTHRGTEKSYNKT